MRILSPGETCMVDPLYYITRTHDRSGGGGGVEPETSTFKGKENFSPCT